MDHVQPAGRRRRCAHALRSLISQWCAVNGFQYDSPESTEGMMECVAASCSSKAAIEANKATARILVSMLEEGSDSTKAVAAWEIRLLAKTGKQNRAFIAELGAIRLLCKLLLSTDWMAQENAVTALLNLSIYEPNKTRIMEQDGCLRLIVSVLKNGWTTEAKENAAATLFSLSVVHDYKKMIMNEPGAVEELACMLAKGTPRGKKDAVMALFNLSTHPESSARMGFALIDNSSELLIWTAWSRCKCYRPHRADNASLECGVWSSSSC